MATAVLAAVVLTASLAPSSPATAQEPAQALEAQATAAEAAGNIKEAFALYVRAFQALPERPPLDVDVRLRSRLVALAAKLEPPTTIPEDAERFTVRGQTLFTGAADPATAEKAAVEFRKAVRAAPWLPALAFNLALVEEALKHYKAATANLKVYLVSNPTDADDVRRKLYAMEVKMEQDPTAAGEEDCDAGDVGACATVKDAYAAAYDLFMTAMYRLREIPQIDTLNAVRILEKNCQRAVVVSGRAPGFICLEVGVAYERGIGPATDLTVAAKYYARGCELGEKLSCDFAARLKR